ncbi:unnamed protein product, partial [Brachionus calyciflorus]
KSLKTLTNRNLNSPLHTRSGKAKSDEDNEFRDEPQNLASISRSESIYFLNFDEIIIDNVDDRTFIVDEDLELNEIEKTLINHEEIIDDEKVSSFSEEINFEYNPIEDFKYTDFEYGKLDRANQLLIVSTQQNKPKLFDNGYFYTIERVGEKKIIMNRI